MNKKKVNNQVYILFDNKDDNRISIYETKSELLDYIAEMVEDYDNDENFIHDISNFEVMVFKGKKLKIDFKPKKVINSEVNIIE